MITYKAMRDAFSEESRIMIPVSVLTLGGYQSPRGNMLVLLQVIENDYHIILKGIRKA
jgi:hypothetical protein